MRQQWQNFYLFMYEAKLAAGIYFAAFVFFYLVFGVFNPGQATTLDFWTAIQFFAACLLIGMGKNFFLGDHATSPARLLMWSAWSLAVTVFFSGLFQWFQPYPAWYRLLFYGAITLSCLLYGLALKWQSQRESKDKSDPQTENGKPD